MAEKITWVRPSGSEITTNGLPATIEYAAKLGWVPKADAKKADNADKKADAKKAS